MPSLVERIIPGYNTQMVFWIMTIATTGFLALTVAHVPSPTQDSGASLVYSRVRQVFAQEWLKALQSAPYVRTEGLFSFAYYSPAG